MPEAKERLERFLAEGAHGDMVWMETTAERRGAPSALWPDVRSVIILGMNYGPDRWIAPGELAYFPEGTPYGPQDYDSERYGMTFQFGGASGSGYISLRRMAEGMEALKQFGTFEKGVFHLAGDHPPGNLV